MQFNLFFYSISLILISLMFQSCQVDERIEFSVRSGDASETLKLYAVQAEVDILFSESDLHGIQTHQIGGRMPAETALKKMISDTGLIFHHDRESQAIAVYYRAPE